MKYIPLRFQADCWFCHDEIDIRKEGTFQRTTGWAKRRSAGGANAISLPERFNEYACSSCIEGVKHRNGGLQFALFE